MSQSTIFDRNRSLTIRLMNMHRPEPVYYGPPVRFREWREVLPYWTLQTWGVQYAECVYVFRDASGTVLYVGRTCNPPHRFDQHHDLAPWWVDVDTVEVNTITCNGHDECPHGRVGGEVRCSALTFATMAWERLAILRLDPTHNKSRAGLFNLETAA